MKKHDYLLVYSRNRGDFRTLLDDSFMLYEHLTKNRYQHFITVRISKRLFDLFRECDI